MLAKLLSNHLNVKVHDAKAGKVAEMHEINGRHTVGKLCIYRVQMSFTEGS